MRPQATLLAGACLVFVSGCASINRVAREEQKIPLTTWNDQTKVSESGALYLWPPYSSAAIVDGKGNRCVLAASGAKTIEASSEAAFKLGKALEKVEGLDASTKSKLTEAFTKLSAADAHAAFVDVALFHLCILDQNGTFKPDETTGQPTYKAKAVMDAYLKTVEAAKSLP